MSFVGIIYINGGCDGQLWFAHIMHDCDGQPFLICVIFGAGLCYFITFVYSFALFVVVVSKFDLFTPFVRLLHVAFSCDVQL